MDKFSDFNSETSKLVSHLFYKYLNFARRTFKIGYCRLKSGKLLIVMETFDCHEVSRH